MAQLPFLQKMTMTFKIGVLFLFLGMSPRFFSQVNPLEISPEQEKDFAPYMYFMHGGTEGLANFKTSQPHTYLKELWYFSKSFYVKRNYLDKGAVLNEAIIDIARFETSRKLDEEAIVVLPGF